MKRSKTRSDHPKQTKTHRSQTPRQTKRQEEGQPTPRQEHKPGDPDRRGEGEKGICAIIAKALLKADGIRPVEDLPKRHGTGSDSDPVRYPYRTGARALSCLTKKNCHSQLIRHLFMLRLFVQLGSWIAYMSRNVPQVYLRPGIRLGHHLMVARSTVVCRVRLDSPIQGCGPSRIESYRNVWIEQGNWARFCRVH